MSDYIYILENHLSAAQNQVVREVQAAAGQANLNLFLTGGAMRDMLAGFRIRDLDFVVEGPALKVAKAVCEASGAKTVSVDETRKSAELVFPSGVTAQIAMSRHEKYGRTGSKPQISAATIQEDLRGRDFACNAIALSLNKASRGLLLDPMNGLADIERRELRAISNYGFYDDPSRLLRLVRFRYRLGYAVEARTEMQVTNAREADVVKSIPARVFGEELLRTAVEDNPAEIVKGLEESGLLGVFAPMLAGSKLNIAGLAKLEKLEKLLPDDPASRAARTAPFFFALMEKLTPKEKQALIKTSEIPKRDITEWQKLEARAKKLESALKSAKVRKPSHVYHIAVHADPAEALLVLYRSALKPVQERLRNYYGKYLPMAQEITPEEFATIEGKPGAPKYEKARAAFISQRLDRKPPKPPVEETPAVPGQPLPPSVPQPPPPQAMAGRRGR